MFPVASCLSFLFFTPNMFYKFLLFVWFVLSVCFFLFVSRRSCVIACFGHASFLPQFFLMAPFWAIVGANSLGTSWGLSSLAPSEALFLARKAVWVFVVDSPCYVCFLPFLWCLRLHTFSLEGPGRDLAVPSPGDLAHPREE